METLHQRPDAGVTLVLVLLCVVVAFGLAGIVMPPVTREPASPEDTLDAVARLVGAATADAPSPMPDGVSWLHGPGRLPRGLARKSAWPLRSWLDHESRVSIPWDPWQRAIVVRPGRLGGRDVLLVICAGKDGVVETAADGRPRGDDLVRVVG